MRRKRAAIGAPVAALPINPQRRLGQEQDLLNARRGLTTALSILQVVASAIFLVSGIAKLAGATAMVVLFEMIGVGQWFRYVTGLLEIAGAVALLIPRLVPYGATLLATVMIGAVVAHLTVVGGSPAPPFVLLVLTGTIGWMRSAKMK